MPSCSRNRKTRKQRGAGCGCGNAALGKIGAFTTGKNIFGSVFGSAKGGYKATKKNLATLRRYKQGKSIGFTATSSLKAKGLIPRSSGQYIVSPKYKGKGGSCGLAGRCGSP